jgi:hypothetical protein
LKHEIITHQQFDKSGRLVGPRNARVFKKGALPVELSPDDDLSFLLK